MEINEMLHQAITSIKHMDALWEEFQTVKDKLARVTTTYDEYFKIQATNPTLNQSATNEVVNKVLQSADTSIDVDAHSDQDLQIMLIYMTQISKMIDEVVGKVNHTSNNSASIMVK